jgi:hypothetical protein
MGVCHSIDRDSGSSPCIHICRGNACMRGGGGGTFLKAVCFPPSMWGPCINFCCTISIPVTLLFSVHIMYLSIIQFINGQYVSVNLVQLLSMIVNVLLTMSLSRPLLRLLYGDIGFVYPACL